MTNSKKKLSLVRIAQCERNTRCKSSFVALKVAVRGENLEKWPAHYKLAIEGKRV